MSDTAKHNAAIDRLVAPVRYFAEHKLAGAILLLVATAAAVVWANSPWGDVYTAALGTVLTVGVGDFALQKPLLLWINDGLMGVFFFVVGLEIKREILAGELSSPRKAALPVAAAIGGMAVPALLYMGLNGNGAGANGWGIPMATDIAFALGVLALLGDRVPAALKVFLTALAIVDDIGAILVIAVFYTDQLSLWSLAIGGGLLGVSVAMNRLGVVHPLVYFLVGVAVWVAFLKSGVHATLAAVLMALTIPGRRRTAWQPFLERVSSIVDALKQTSTRGARGFLSGEQQYLLDDLADAVEKGTAPLQRLEHTLMPLVTFFVMPVFALANAGVVVGASFADALTSRITIGIVLGLFLGKQVGVLGFSWLAVRLGVADLPVDVSWRQIHGVGAIAGIGFTMSLFVAGLAFSDPALGSVAKVGILAGSLLSGVVGYALLRSASQQ